MEPQSQQQQLASDHHNGKAVQSNYLCRQSSTRWTPTTDQIKILKDLYYKEGVRSPNADQIQKISAQLRQFGKIEGKNVFYWFQNHKARERQKKKFTSLNSNPAHAIRYPNFTPGISCPSSSAGGMVSVGHCGYGHMSMENNYLKECGVAAYGNGGLYSYPSQSFQWSNGMNPYTLMENARNPNQVQLFDDQDQEKAPELETLPLFPIHAEDSSVGSFNGGTNVMRATEPDNNNNNCYNNTSSCHWLNPQTTLELSLNLNSYGDHQWPNY